MLNFFLFFFFILGGGGVFSIVISIKLYIILMFKKSYVINLLLTNGHSNAYHLDESKLFLGITRVVSLFFSFFNEFPVSKQDSPRWDAVFAASHVGILFVYVP